MTDAWSTRVTGLQKHELRAHLRVRAALAVTQRTVWVNTPTASQTGDLSVGGCFITRPGRHEQGKRLHLELHLPEGPLVIDGEVAHCAPDSGFGVRFVNLTAEQTAALVRTVTPLLGTDSRR